MSAYPAKFKQADIARREIQLIHIARQQTDMDEDTYRAMLHDRFGVSSSKDMDWRQRKQLLDHFKMLGFKVTPSKTRPQSRALADDAQSKKIRELWLTLHTNGKVRNPDESALAAFVKRQTKVDALQWLSTKQASAVIEELKKWLAR